MRGRSVTFQVVTILNTLKKQLRWVLMVLANTCDLIVSIKNQNILLCSSCAKSKNLAIINATNA